MRSLRINKEGYASESYGGMTVALDISLTPELIDEGIARELVSKLQTMRKEAGFNVTDRICVSYIASGRAADVLERNGGVARDVLADCVKGGATEGYVKEWDINGEQVTLGVIRS